MGLFRAAGKGSGRCCGDQCLIDLLNFSERSVHFHLKHIGGYKGINLPGLETQSAWVSIRSKPANKNSDQ